LQCVFAANTCSIIARELELGIEMLNIKERQQKGKAVDKNN
jgi:hypothetical protein